MSSLLLKSASVEQIFKRRKLDLRTIGHDCVVFYGQKLEVIDLEKFVGLCKTFAISLSDVLIQDEFSVASNLPVAICRKAPLYTKDKFDTNGKHIYTYRNVHRNACDVGLMVYRTSLKSLAAPLNAGHAAKEIVYILNGKVRLSYSKQNGKEFVEDMAEGDSVFLAPWVRHSFSKLSEDAEILAIDYF